MIDIRTRASGAARIEGGNHALTVIAAGVVVAILYWARAVFITAMVAIIIALILQPFVTLLQRLKLPRALAAFIVCVLALFVLYMAGVAAYNQLAGISAEAPAFRQRLEDMITNVSTRVNAIEDAAARMVTSRKNPPAETPQPSRNRRRKASPPAPAPPGEIQEVRIHPDATPLIGYIYERLSRLYDFILMASFVPFLVYFMLSWQEHIYRRFLRFFDGETRVSVSRSLQGIAGMARAFVVGNFLIGIIAAVIGSAAFALLRIPFPVIAGVLSGFLTLFPYIGLPLAVIPPVLAGIAGGVSTSALLGAAAVTGGMHLFAMNVLYPKLVGARVHLNPLVVTFALMIFAFLWNAAGLILAIPITAGIKAVCDSVPELRPYGRFLGD